MEALALLDDADYEEMAVDKKTRRVVRIALKKMVRSVIGGMHARAGPSRYQ